MSKLVPLRDMVVIEKIDPPGQTAGGVLLPRTLTEEYLTARVVAVGPGLPPTGSTTPNPIPLQPGDVVVLEPSFRRRADYEHEGRRVLLVFHHDILAKQV